ncbi:MAG: transposase, partial [Terracidiphilus sp.]
VRFVYAPGRVQALAASKLATARVWKLKEDFGHFWKYKSVPRASGFLDAGCERALRSPLEPMKGMARTLRAHEGRLRNGFRARGKLSSATVEGLINKLRVVTRRSCGFRT